MRSRVPCAVALVLGLRATVATAGLGTDLAGLRPCLYGDCEARGSYAADPFGWANPATMPVGTLQYTPRGATVGLSFFRFNAGGVVGDIGSATVAAAASPFVLGFTGIYASADGTADSIPGIDLDLTLRAYRFLGGVDLDRWLGIRGLSVGLMADVPGTTTDLSLETHGVTVAKIRDDHEIDLTGGLHWRGGEREWFMVGGFLSAMRNREVTESAGHTTYDAVNAWISRVGVSLVPAIPLHLDGRTPGRAWLGSFRLGTDVEYRNVSAPGEHVDNAAVAYFGGDALVLPDAWNPLARWVQVYAVGGVDTQGGWGVGAAIYGDGPLRGLGCTPSYSSRPQALSLGDRFDLWSATCGAQIGF